MGGAAHSRAKRIAAGVMGLMMLVLVLLSALYMAAEADHDCAGEDCPVCERIQACGSILRRLSAGTAAWPAAAVSAVPCLLIAVLPAVSLPRATLVSRRIRLND